MGGGGSLRLWATGAAALVLGVSGVLGAFPELSLLYYGGSLGEGLRTFVADRAGSRPVLASLPVFYEEREEGEFSVLYPRGERGREEVLLALEELKNLAPRVARELGLPLRPLYLVLCSREGRASCARNGGEEVTGSYAAGWMWLYLSPEDPLFSVTLVHETAHALAAGSSGGRVPLWLDEGFALLAEELVLGEKPFDRRVAGYPLGLLERNFASLERDSAYREAYLFASFLRERRGREVWPRLLGELASGSSAREVLRAVTGKDLFSLEAEFRDWLGSSAPGFDYLKR